MPLVDRKSRSGSKSQKSIGFEFTDGGWSWWSMSRIVRWWNGNQELHMSTLLGYLDPGTNSLLLQLLLGGAAGLTLALRSGWDGFVAKFARTRRD